ncbi:uncharacterized protein LOC124166123 [Ischnura elegans]|uniref:uncharacterized protein LOC124166123 n=1 Tax=Ischnura elegans TaxID=197161 RepID=UPI001ED8979A|nr:uncharacterized protein LOC124166123 [Ischnura elegans]
MPSTPLGKTLLACKILEFVIVCICMGLHVNSQMIALSQYSLVTIVFGAYIIIISGMLLGFVVCERISRKIDMYYTLLGMALFVAAGSCLISNFSGNGIFYHHNVDIGLAAGSLAIINAILMLVDAVITFKDVHEYTPH